MSLIHNPHDKFFKQTFGDPGTARNFLKHYLPPDVLTLVDLETIERQKDSYVDQELKESFSDLLFQAQIHEHEGYIYFLFEHKAHPSPGAALQLLKYMVRIWERKLEESPTGKIPLIIPMVVYHGQEKWNASRRLSGMIEHYGDLPAAVTKYIPEYEYILYNLSACTDQELPGDILLRIILKTLREIFNKDTAKFQQFLRELLFNLEGVKDQEKGLRFFEILIRYILSTRQDLELRRVYEMAKDISLERSEVIMTIAEKLILEGKAKGLEEGRKEGLKEGMEKGMEKGKLEVAKNMLGLGIEMDKIAKATALPKEEIRKLLN